MHWNTASSFSAISNNFRKPLHIEGNSRAISVQFQSNYHPDFDSFSEQFNRNVSLIITNINTVLEMVMIIKKKIKMGISSVIWERSRLKRASSK